MKKYEQARLEDVLQSGSRVAFYARVSTEEQDCAMQENAVEMFLERYGCKIGEGLKYIDPAVSAMKIPLKERKKFQELISDAEKRKFDVIVTYKNDRLARSVEEHQEIRKRMRELNMHIVLSSTHELYTVGEIVSQTVKDGLTKIEAAITQERTRDTFRSKTKRGKWFGGKAPYGYTYRVIEENNGGQKTRIEEFKDEKDQQEVVTEIYRLFEIGYGFQQIANEIKNRKLDEDMKWSKEKIRYIITNPFYCGLMSMNRYDNGTLNDQIQWVKGEVKGITPLFTREYWEYVMKLFEDRKKRKIHSRDYSTPFLLRGILYCHQCNELMTTKNQEPGGVKYKGKKTEQKRRIYECKNCDFKLQAKTIHEKFQSEYLPYILDQITQQKKEHVESEIEKRLKKEMKNLKDTNKKLDEKIVKLNQQIEELSEEIKSYYEKEIIEDEVLEFMKIIMAHRTNKIHELNAVKDKKFGVQERIDRIAQTIRQKKYLPPYEVLNDFTKKNVDTQKLRAFLLQFFKFIHVASDGNLVLEINERLMGL
ncbi:recombinase family protein [Bacillus paranthracis]|uniref:recombinase family protein n=1 Tax=Bacillus cereus group TaxID=86661 RepID=UPI0009B3B0AF|nr:MULTISPECIES: recombinase family protein [Bacillus cereus group]MCC2457973.1 recombinase family protein [Bacillus cereus]MCC2478476.1 recombinase family protein [Bacillus paranthracis]MCU5017635.1 recombinase family protein [Bacillus paranthracis]MCU5450287.1 recombinase family protein [Bacillus cereus]MDA2008986.1 recombinase family protein [Bacillus cereus group sp. Bcc09]